MIKKLIELIFDEDRLNYTVKKIIENYTFLLFLIIFLISFGLIKFDEELLIQISFVLVMILLYKNIRRLIYGMLLDREIYILKKYKYYEKKKLKVLVLLKKIYNKRNNKLKNKITNLNSYLKLKILFYLNNSYLKLVNLKKIIFQNILISNLINQLNNLKLKYLINYYKLLFKIKYLLLKKNI